MHMVLKDARCFRQIMQVHKGTQKCIGNPKLFIDQINLACSELS
jgi:hypothetical protein